MQVKGMHLKKGLNAYILEPILFTYNKNFIIKKYMKKLTYGNSNTFVM